MATDLEQLRFCLQVSHLQQTPGIDRKWLRQILLRDGQDADLYPLQSLCGGQAQSHKIEQTACRAYAAGIRACCAADAVYPYRLRQISGCPLVLYYRGQDAAAKWNHPFAVTLIGTRNPTQYGRIVTRQISADLADQGALVISGMARGIDALAHRTVLDRHGLTIAVVAQGVDQAYPPEHLGLMEEITANGLVISEHPPGTKPKRSYFPARNRILSGLADVIAIMEASQQSGTLITAGFAADQGREVFAVPGSILQGRSKGCHQLIREGAGIIETAADLLALRRTDNGSVEFPLFGALQEASEENKPESQVSRDDRARLKDLGCAALTLEAIAEHFGWSIRQTTAWLSLQELAGLVYRERGRYVLTERGFFCI
ncbi:MAG: DNA-processing protein DprA [Bacillota bacterium]|nr:DNA-processing protein DprA [Bacillota bacterium]